MATQEEIRKSQELYEELQKLERGWEKIEGEKYKGLQAPGLRELMLSILLAERILDPNDPEILNLRGQLETHKEWLLQGERDYKKTRNLLNKELFVFSGPFIQEIIQKLNRMTADRELKREILSKKYDGINRRTILTVSSNENAIRLIHKKISDGIKQIQGMTLKPISAIREAGNRIDEDIKGVDLRRMEKLEMDENDYFRGQPPAGVDPGDKYEGPRSGL